MRECSISARWVHRAGHEGWKLDVVGRCRRWLEPFALPLLVIPRRMDPCSLQLLEVLHLQPGHLVC